MANIEKPLAVARCLGANLTNQWFWADVKMAPRTRCLFEFHWDSLFCNKWNSSEENNLSLDSLPGPTKIAAIIMLLWSKQTELQSDLAMIGSVTLTLLLRRPDWSSHSQSQSLEALLTVCPVPSLPLSLFLSDPFSRLMNLMLWGIL